MKGYYYYNNEEYPSLQNLSEENNLPPMTAHSMYKKGMIKYVTDTSPKPEVGKMDLSIKELPQPPDGFIRFEVEKIIWEHKNARYLLKVMGKKCWFEKVDIKLGLSNKRHVVDVPQLIAKKKKLI